MHKNISFIPLFYNKSGGTDRKYFCIDPQETEKSSFHATDVGTERHFFCIDPAGTYIIFRALCGRNAFPRGETVEGHFTGGSALFDAFKVLLVPLFQP